MGDKIRVDFSGYNIRTPDCGTSGEIFLLDLGNRTYEKVPDGDDKSTNSSSSERFIHEYGAHKGDNSLVYAIQRYNDTLSVSCMMQAESTGDHRSKSMPAVRVELPKGYVPEDPKAMVRYVTSLAEGFEKEFIRNGMQYPVQGKTFEDACLDILATSADKLPLKPHGMNMPRESGSKSVPLTPEQAIYVKVASPERLPTENDAQYLAKKRLSTETWAVEAVEGFIENPSLKESLITSEHNARSISKQYTSLKIDERLSTFPPGKEPPLLTAMPAIDPQVLNGLQGIGKATDTNGQITLATKDVPMPSTGKKGELGG